MCMSMTGRCGGAELSARRRPAARGAAACAAGAGRSEAVDQLGRQGQLPGLDAPRSRGEVPVLEQHTHCGQPADGPARGLRLPD